MKKRSMFMASFALVLLLVVGGTMAWFTDKAEVTNSFKAGTVKIDLVDEFQENGITNVNPGDTHAKVVYVKNTGSKKVYVRVQLIPTWELADNQAFKGHYTADTLPPAELMHMGEEKLEQDYNEKDWIKVGKYYYYKEILNPLTATEGTLTTNLIDAVHFIGANMGNEYQEATFKLTVKAEAIQASNGAIEDLWKIDPKNWTKIVPAP